jgi:FolB domain-containing protein
MSTIRISDLEVFYRVGVPEEERAVPQRLLLSFDLELDFDAAVSSDDISKTINYYAVVQDVLHFGAGRSWKLIETLASDLAEMVLRNYRPASVSVEVKKFIISQAQYISVRLTRTK